MKQNVTFLFVLLILELVCGDSVENNDDDDEDEDEDEESELRRPLQTGDIFTPNDFLEIAKRLRDKVEDPGTGKGIVSSSKSVPALADKLYKEFFFTNARIIPLRDVDMAGIDALQALALAGTEFDPEIHFIGLPRSQRRYLFQAKCQYALITRRLQDFDDARRAIKTPRKRRRKRKRALRNPNKPTIKPNKVIGNSIKAKAKPDLSKGKPYKLLKTLAKNRLLKVSKRDMTSEGQTATNNSNIPSQQVSEENDGIRVNLPRANHSYKEVLHDIRHADSRKSHQLLRTVTKKREIKVRRRNNRAGGRVAANASTGFPQGPNGNQYEEIDVGRLIHLEQKFKEINNLNDTGDQSEVNKRYTRYDQQLKRSLSTSAPERRFDNYDEDAVFYREKLPKDRDCIWMFRCKDISIMESCHVYPECAEGNKHFDIGDLPIHHLPDEHQENIKEVRRILGITIVDEEVAKIMERRYMIMLPRMTEERDHKRPIENVLVGYFERLAQVKQSATTPVYRPIKKRNRNEKKYLKAKKNWSLDKDNHIRPTGSDKTEDEDYGEMESVTHPFRK